MQCNKNYPIENHKTIKDCLKEATIELENSDIEDAKHNVSLLAAKLLNVPYTKLPLFWKDQPSINFEKDLHSLINRRIAKEPLQYILGEWCFLDLDVNVKPGVLIPRPETEEVFLAASETIKSSSLPQNFSFADIGTGTGILGLSMAMYFPKSKGVLVDISEEALNVAKSNLAKYPQLSSQIEIKKSDLLEIFEAKSLDVIISNPPYIDSKDIEHLMPEVVNYEPHLALDGGPTEGLDIINKLLIQSETVLKPHGFLIFEHGHGQRSSIKQIISSKWNIIKEGNDFAGNERYFILQRSKGL